MSGHRLQVSPTGEGWEVWGGPRVPDKAWTFTLSSAFTPHQHMGKPRQAIETTFHGVYA